MMKNSFLVFLVFLLSFCNYKQKILRLHKKNFEEIKYTKEATSVAKKILVLLKKKNTLPQEYIPYLVYLSKYAKTVEEKTLYTEQLAALYLKTPFKINRAIQIWFDLIKTTQQESKKTQYQFYLAKAYFKENKYKQAVLELKNIKQQKGSFLLSIYLLKIKIFLELKDWQKIIVLYKNIKKQFFAEYKKQELALNLIFIYEHLTLHYLALQELKDLKTYYIFPHLIQKRIITIQKRIKNQPRIKR